MIYFLFFMFKFEKYTFLVYFHKKSGNPAFGMIPNFGWIISTPLSFYGMNFMSMRQVVLEL